MPEKGTIRRMIFVQNYFRIYCRMKVDDSFFQQYGERQSGYSYIKRKQMEVPDQVTMGEDGACTVPVFMLRIL